MIYFLKAFMRDLSLLVKHEINFHILSVKKHLIELLIEHKNILGNDILLILTATGQLIARMLKN